MGLRGLALLAVLAVALGIATTGGSAPESRLASFRPASGWLVERVGADNPSLVVAVTARDASAVHPVALFGSFKKLSRNGILVWADTVGRGRRGFTTATAWPPRLAGFRVDHGWEGQPAANIQQRVWVGSVHGWDLDIRVFFRDPTSQRSAADQGASRAGSATSSLTLLTCASVRECPRGRPLNCA
jgi:hypothetical protein